MAMKDIKDWQVVLAYLEYKDTYDEKEEHPHDILMRETGESFKVCYKCCERASERGYIECGVSLQTGWVTSEGMHYLYQTYDSGEFKVCGDEKLNTIPKLFIESIEKWAVASKEPYFNFKLDEIRFQNIKGMFSNDTLSLGAVKQDPIEFYSDIRAYGDDFCKAIKFVEQLMLMLVNYNITNTWLNYYKSTVTENLFAIYAPGMIFKFVLPK